MRTFAAGIAAAALAGTMTAIPVHAQTIGVDARGAPVRVVVVEPAPVERRHYSEDGSTYAVLDERNDAWRIYDADDESFLRASPADSFEPNRSHIVEVPIERDLVISRQFVTEERYYDPERETYAVFDPVGQVWNVFDADSDRMIDSFAEDAYEPHRPGYAEVRVALSPAIGASGEPDRALLESGRLAAGTAQERYYDPDRRTYAVFEPADSAWQIYDAETGRLVDVLAGSEFRPYEPGYTVMVPGGAQVGMGVEGESTLADQVPVLETRE